MLLIVAAGALSVLFLSLGSGRKAAVADRLDELAGSSGQACTDPARERKRSLPAALLTMPYRVAGDRLRHRLFARLEALEGRPGIDVPRLAGACAYVTAALPLAVLLAMRFSTPSLLLAPVLIGAGLLLPRAAAARADSRHLDAVRRALPDTADTLYALILGGKNLDQAFRGAAVQSPEPLGTLLRRTVREIELGSTRAEAFEKLAGECPVRELTTLLRTLIEAEKRGSSLSAMLSVFSREIRLRRRDALRQAGAKAPLKMLAPLIFLILPASVLLTVGPTFLATLSRVM